jgi:hypothetical protein
MRRDHRKTDQECYPQAKSLDGEDLRKISRVRVLTIGSGRDIPMIAIVDDDEAVREATELLVRSLG